MSRQDVEAARALFAAFAERDLEAAAEVMDPSIEIHPAIVGGPEGTVYRGPDGMRRFWDDIDAAWAEYRITPDELRELDGKVLVLGQALAHGRDSGIVLETAAGWIVTLRGGRIVRFESFSSRRDALDAAGLSE